MPCNNDNARHEEMVYVFKIIKNMFDNEHHCQTLTGIWVDDARR